MKEIEMKQGQAHEINPTGETLQLGAAVNKHIAARNIADIDQMRQEDTMRDMLAILRTEAKLQELIASQTK